MARQRSDAMVVEPSPGRLASRQSRIKRNYSRRVVETRSHDLESVPGWTVPLWPGRRGRGAPRRAPARAAPRADFASGARPDRELGATPPPLVDLPRSHRRIGIVPPLRSEPPRAHPGPASPPRSGTIRTDPAALASGRFDRDRPRRSAQADELAVEPDRLRPRPEPARAGLPLPASARRALPRNARQLPGDGDAFALRLASGRMGPAADPERGAGSVRGAAGPPGARHSRKWTQLPD